MAWLFLIIGILIIAGGIIYLLWIIEKKTRFEHPQQSTSPLHHGLTVSTQKDPIVNLFELDVFTDNRLDPVTNSQFEFVRAQFQPNKGWLSTWLQELASKRSIEFIKTLSDHERAIIEHGAVLERAARERKKELVEFNKFLQQEKLAVLEIAAKAAIVTGAAKANMTIEDYSFVNKERILTELRIKEFQETDGKLKPWEKEQELSKIEVEKYRQKSTIDLENEVKLAQEQLRFKITANHLTGQKAAAFIQDLIDEQYIIIAQTRMRDDIPQEAKDNIIKGRERIVEMYEKQQHEEQNK